MYIETYMYYCEIIFRGGSIFIDFVEHNSNKFTTPMKMTPINIQVSRSKVKFKGHASLPHLVRRKTPSNLVGRYQG